MLVNIERFERRPYSTEDVAKNAAAVVEHEPLVRGVNRQRWIAICQRDMSDTLPLRQGLQFALLLATQTEHMWLRPAKSDLNIIWRCF